MRAFFTCLIVFFGPMTAFGQEVSDEQPVYEPAVLQQLLRAQVAIETIEGMVQRGEITEAQRVTGVEYHLAQAREAAGDAQLTQVQLSGISGQLGAVPHQLTWGQRALGFFTFVNIMWTIAAIMGVVCLVWLLIVMGIPAVLYEFMGYAGAIAMLVIGHGQAEGVSEYVTFFGALLLIGMPFATAAIHEISPTPTAMFGIATVVSGACALLVMNPMIGWLTAIALMGMLGFSAMVIPCGYVIGFKDEDGLSRATSSGFLLLFIFTVIHATGRETQFSNLFADAMLWVGSFVAYLGLLIASSRWYTHRQAYVVMQVITVVAGIAALFVGSVFGIPELQKIGGTFFVLYLIEKLCEIPARSIEGYLALGVCVSAVLFVIAWTIKQNADALAPYLLWG